MTLKFKPEFTGVESKQGIARKPLENIRLPLTSDQLGETQGARNMSIYMIMDAYNDAIEHNQAFTSPHLASAFALTGETDLLVKRDGECMGITATQDEPLITFMVYLQGKKRYECPKYRIVKFEVIGS